VGKEQGTEEQAAMLAAVAAPAPILVVEWCGTPTRAPVWSEAASASAFFFFFLRGASASASLLPARGDGILARFVRACVGLGLVFRPKP
jgi:hypothetical protein